MKLTALVPCELPKFNPFIVTWVLGPPDPGEVPVIIGMVPKAIEVLLNVAVKRVEDGGLAAARPMYTVCAMVMLWLVPTWVQFEPSCET